MNHLANAAPREEGGISAPGNAPGNAPGDTLAPLLAEIRARRGEFSAQRHVSPDIVEAFRRVGVYRAMVSRRFGGEERSPAEFCRLIERISAADGSAGWVASFGAAATYLAALPEPTLRQVYAEGPDVVFAGGLFPLQPARRVPGGFVVKGRWKFGSGCTGASLIGVGIAVEGEQGGLPRVAVMPAGQVEIRPNWEVIGLQGTGSHDLVVNDVFVPEEWTLIRGGPASVDSPAYRYPSLGLAAQVLAVVGLGVARAALDEVTEMAGGRASITGAPRMADRPYVQSEVARAEALLRSARAFFYEATEQVWATAVAGGKLPVEEASLLRLAATHAARTGAEVARLACGLAGTTSIYEGHGLARAMCDSLVVAQHAFLGEGTLQSAGRVLLGLPTTPGFP
ncbi:flavin-dependent monooxygenase [Roseomonas sp. NAR14]|uniref:Flavin-dependent monooxygenase n=1 Tax=Roseomonas acroporae TaxID=2937791 RepID=A0A9X2BXG9_9PROT|nr:acyl-CoA dehydrogenase family protein [Roseomonas acroporae]MCK8785954.1 flavin-dependent monooxygenase [Roseomonas acroporae]